MTPGISLQAPLLRRSGAHVLPLVFVLCALAGCAGGKAHGSGPVASADWREPNQNLSSTRAASGSSITSSSVRRLKVAWRFRFPGIPGFSGFYSSTPLIVGNRVLVEDLNSNVYALDRRTGRLLWAKRYHQMNGGPNGLAVAGSRVFGDTATSEFALQLDTGHQIWLRRLTTTDNPISVAPLVANGIVYTSTVAQTAGGRGELYALAASSGAPMWTFDTILHPWRFPAEAYGGGMWDAPSLGADGTLYAGNSNPYPYGGSRRHPDGTAYPGQVLFTDSLLALAAASGKLEWYDQVTPHDIHDFDFQDSPVLASSSNGTQVVVGAGKAGRVIAWNSRTHKRMWQRSVGRHLHDTGSLPSRPTTVCPGLLGGVETPMAYTGGEVFVPVVDLCIKESATGSGLALVQTDYSKGKGELVALSVDSGAIAWQRKLPSPNFGCATVANDVVFTVTYDGKIYAFQTKTGSLLWSEQAPAGVNSCPAVAGGTLIVGAGVLLPDNPASDPELVAYRVSPGP